MNKFEDMFKPISIDEHLDRICTSPNKENTEEKIKILKLLVSHRNIEALDCVHITGVREYRKEHYNIRCYNGRSNFLFREFVINNCRPPLPFCMIAGLQEYLRSL